MDTKAFLEQGLVISKLIEEMERKREELRRTSQRMRFCKDGASTAEQLNGGKKELLLCQLRNLDQRIMHFIGELAGVEQDILAVIENVPDMTCRTILTMKYLNGITLEQIAEELCYSPRHLARLHAKALGMVQVPHERESSCLS